MFVEVTGEKGKTGRRDEGGGGISFTSILNMVKNLQTKE